MLLEGVSTTQLDGGSKTSGAPGVRASTGTGCSIGSLASGLEVLQPQTRSHEMTIGRPECMGWLAVKPVANATGSPACAPGSVRARQRSARNPSSRPGFHACGYDAAHRSRVRRPGSAYVDSQAGPDVDRLPPARGHRGVRERSDTR